MSIRPLGSSLFYADMHVFLFCRVSNVCSLIRALKGGRRRLLFVSVFLLLNLTLLSMQEEMSIVGPPPSPFTHCIFTLNTSWWHRWACQWNLSHALYQRAVLHSHQTPPVSICFPTSKANTTLVEGLSFTIYLKGMLCALRPHPHHILPVIVFSKIQILKIDRGHFPHSTYQNLGMKTILDWAGREAGYSVSRTLPPFQGAPALPPNRRARGDLFLSSCVLQSKLDNLQIRN